MLKKVVLTGAPCSGKTVAIREIAAQCQEQVIVVPEVALIALDMQLSRGNVSEKEVFQEAVVKMQVDIERAAEHAAKRLNKTLLLLDRGLYDAVAYFECFCQRPLDLEKCLGGASEPYYHRVLLLESAYDLVDEAVRGSNNRIETAEDVAAIEFKLREVWQKRYQVDFLRKRESVKDKVNDVMKILAEEGYVSR
jgi:predicted ATPase